MPSQIFFKDGGAGLSSVKYTCAGDMIVASSAGGGSVDTAAEKYGSVTAVAGDGSVSASAGDGSAVGRTGVSDGLGTGADGALHL